MRSYLTVIISLVVMLPLGCATVQGPVGMENKLSSQDRAVLAFFCGQLAHQKGDFDKAVDYYREALGFDPANPNLWHSLVGDLIRLGRLQEAITEYRQLTAQQEANPEVRCVLGQMHEAVGDIMVAESLYRDAIALGGKKSEPFTYLGRLLIKQSKINEAIDVFQKALEINPRDRQARRVLIKCFLSREQETKAVQLLEEALLNEPKDIEWMAEQGRIMAGLKRDEEAAQIYRRLIKYYPEFPEAYRFLSIYHLQHYEWKAAAEQLGKLLKLEPDNMLAQRNSGLALYELGHLDEARKYLFALIKSGNADAFTHFLMGIIYRKKGFNYLAEQELRLALQMDPEIVEAYLGLAGILMKIGEEQPAIEVLEKACNKFPNSVQVLTSYGLALLRLERPEEALKIFTQSLRGSPGNARLYFHLGRVHLEMKEFEKAVHNWQQAIKLDPEFAEVYNYMGYVHAERGLKLEQAVGWLKKALKLDSQNGYYRDSLGWAYYKQKKYDLALRELEQAREEIKKKGLVDPVIYDHLGDVYFKLGKHQKADQAWRRALKGDPENQEIEDKLQELRLRLKNRFHEISHY